MKPCGAAASKHVDAIGLLQVEPLTLAIAAENAPSVQIAGISDPLGGSVGFPLWKRALDIVVSISLFAFTAPLLTLVALAIAMDGGPIVFRQPRIGTGGKLFRVIKFRTMSIDADARLAALLSADERSRLEWEQSHKLRNDPRVTFVGSFLRKSSIDEFPQLLNVLCGEMSIVGPRPIVTSELRHYGRYIRHYQQCRPGITGLWQVSGRSDVSYRRRVALDTIYCRKQCDVLIDVAILLKTVPAVLLSRGSY